MTEIELKVFLDVTRNFFEKLGAEPATLGPGRVSFDDPKVTYLVLADGSGHVVWQAQGPATDEKAAALEAAIVKLQAQPH